MARYAAISDTGTEVASLVPAIITPEVLASAAAQEVFMQLCRRFDFTGQPGSTFDVNQAPDINFGALTEATEPDESAFTTTARTITPVQRFVDVIITSKAVLDSVTSLEDQVVEEMGIALAHDRDALAAALYDEASLTTPDHFIGADATALDLADLINGMQLLYTQRARKPYSWAVHPIQVGELMADAPFYTASTKGAPVLTEGIGDNGFFTNVMDVNCYMSPEVIQGSSGSHTTGLHSMMFGSGAIGYGFKRMASPLSPTPQELLIDIEWNSPRRHYEINATYYADFEGLRDTSTTNKWMVDIIS